MMNKEKHKQMKEYENKLIHNVIKSIEKNGGDKYLSSIILTGSFGRGEPTYTTDVEGRILLKSDVEIALIYHDGKKNVEELINRVKKEFSEDLNLMALSERRVKKANNFNYTLVTPKYKTIFTFDLFNGSKTIWGKDYISEKIIKVNECDMYEAKRLVANRIGELICLQNTAPKNEADYLRSQWKGKLILAIASAWLICKSTYMSSYHMQYKQIMKDEKSIAEWLGVNFMEDYKKVFIFLRDNGTAYEVDDYKMYDYVKSINKIFEAEVLCTPKVNNLCRVFKYTIKYINTDMKYGKNGFENNILQSLIEEYYMQNQRISETAEVWRKVLY